MIDDRHIDSFNDDLSGRENSGRYNDLREEFLVWLVNSSPQTIESVKASLRRSARLDLIRTAFGGALDDLEHAEGLASAPGSWSAERKGGRGHSFDFELVRSHPHGSLRVEVELKRGQSIYDQPQFWQIYTNYPHLLQDTVPTYAEFFFDYYVSDLANRFDVPAGSRSDYLKSVYRTTADSQPFTTFRQVSLQGGPSAQILKDVHYQSIHDYITFLLTLPGAGLNATTFQERLYRQLSKRFLSWDPGEEMFHWEAFDRASLTLSGAIETRGKRSGQRHTLVLATVTGQQLHLLLRWKNRSCVLGPAWQIKLTP